ncbi:MAG: DUF362 domain-containing protein [Candidatus Saccharicenans sp.]|jgi:uncharacterized Fe-S center protein|nr:DUF362 domain-containing protein [Candidatus Saccharicenans sp.]MDH7492593.1 DUF362 domain-containing protein [Candidatus Saccharicenans sp.]
MRKKVYFIKASREEEAAVIARKARAIYLALGLNEKIEPEDFVALKIHFGEKNNTGHIKPRWLTGIIDEVLKKSQRAFLSDSNTLYVGNRSNSVDHIRLAWEHGFTPDVVKIPVIIADGLVGREKTEVKIEGQRIQSSRIASAFLHSDVMLCLTHVTGHVQSGVGAAIKNLGMGCASRAGKLDQHSVVHPRVNTKQCRNCGVCIRYCPAEAMVQAESYVMIDDEKCIGCGECLVVCKYGAIKMKWDEDSRRLQEKMAEYALSVKNHFQHKIGFINFILQVTKDCDCMAKNQPAIVEDVGLVGSLDPVAVDRASIDLVLKVAGQDAFKKGYNIDWSVQLAYGEKIGLGSQKYELVEIKDF